MPLNRGFDRPHATYVVERPEVAEVREVLASEATPKTKPKSKPGARLREQMALTRDILEAQKKRAVVTPDAFAEALYDHLFTG